jgi:shikimate kinase
MNPQLRRPSSSIVLVGLMGAGKSTVGRRLAARLGLAFADSDEEIERAAGRSINEIFQRFGESEFRDGERRVIARLVAGPPKVIATGGGAFMNENTRTLILGNCISVWLDADVATLAERVSRRDTRPLVSGKDPHQVLRDLAERRNPFYALAHIHVRGERLPHDRTVDQILDGLAKLTETQ